MCVCVCQILAQTKDARSWLESYADAHGEKSPMTGLVFLPAGRRAFYHAAYVFDRHATIVESNQTNEVQPDLICKTRFPFASNFTLFKSLM